LLTTEEEKLIKEMLHSACNTLLLDADLFITVLNALLSENFRSDTLLSTTFLFNKGLLDMVLLGTLLSVRQRASGSR